MKNINTNNEDIKLIEPTLELKSEFIKMAKDFRAAGDERFSKAFKNFYEYVQELERFSKGENLPKGLVPFNRYWLINKKYRCLGQSALRHYLTEDLKQEGGHIGYKIRPTERNKGYGTLILKLTLEKARQFGFERVLVTCDDDNSASARIIEKNGGRMADKIQPDHCEKLVRRYWIDL